MLNHTLSAVQHFLICCICFIWKGKEKYLCLSLGLQWVTLWAPSISKNTSVIQRILVPTLSSSPSQPWGSWGVSPGLGTVHQQWQLSCSEFMSPASAAKDFTSICVFHLLFHLQLSFSWFFFFLSMKNVIFPIQGNTISKNVIVVFPVQGNTAFKNVILSVDALEKHKLAWDL